MSAADLDTFRIVNPSVPRAVSDEIKLRLEQAPKDSIVDELSDLTKSAPLYQVDDDLATAINMALCVRAPLLVTGEPGTGKTQVAYYLRWYLGNAPLFRFQVRSTSTATDLKYDFDAVAYLRYGQDQKAPKKERWDPEFLKQRALWQAYESTEPCILLIDEIDKAPRDFPNDLLRELDEHEFEHPFLTEAGKDGKTSKVLIKPKAKRPPIVIATSNAERKLPDAFLRRCIVHHIELNDTFIQKVVEARVGRFPNLDADTRKLALKRFFEVRARKLSRTPSTAEALTWLTVLSAMRVERKQFDGVALNRLPALQALVKDPDDHSKLA